MTRIILWAALGAVAYTYVLFPLLLVVRASLFSRPVRADDYTPSITVVIAARNEEAVIAHKLESILGNAYPDNMIEVIVASDGSNDGTQSIVHSFVARGVRLLALPAMGKARALNAAVADAHGDVLVFTDANGELAPGALRALARPFGDPMVGGVAGDQRYATDGMDNALGVGERKYWRFDRFLKRAEGRAGNVISSTGALHAIRRDLFESVPPHVTDDAFLSMGVIARGFRLVFAPEAAVIEPLAPAPRAEIGRKVRVMTRGFRTVLERRRLLNPFRYGFYSLELLSHKVLRRLMVLPLAALLVSSLLLWDSATPVKVLAVIQLVGYGAGGLGIGLARTRIGRLLPLALPAFFVAANVAALIAIVHVIRGRTIESWHPVRAKEGFLATGVAIGVSPTARRIRLEHIAALVIASVVGLATGRQPAAMAIVVVAATLGAFLLINPVLATLAAVGLIFSNATVVAVQEHGLPSIISFVVPLLLAVPLVYHIFMRKEPIVVAPALPYVVGYLAVLAVSATQARNTEVAVGEIVTFVVEGVGLFFIVTNVVRSREMLFRCVRVILLVAALLSAFAVIRNMTGAYDQRFLGFAGSPQTVVTGDALEEVEAAAELGGFRREAGPIGDPNRFAQFLLPLIPLGLGAASMSRTRRDRYLAVGIVWLVLGGIILTFSRGAFLGLVFTVILLLVLRQVQASHLLAGVGFLLVLLVAIPAYRERVLSLLTAQGLIAEGESATADNAIQGRYTEVAAAALAFADHPVLGLGPGNFESSYRDYANRVPARVHGGERRAHNMYVGIAAETGGLGLVAIMGVFLVTLRDLARARRRAPDSEGRAIATKFMIAVLALLVTGLFLHLAFIRYLWLFLGLAAAAARLALAGDVANASEVEQREPALAARAGSQA